MMPDMHWLDVALALALLWIALAALTSRDLFRAVVLFIAFGLLLSLVWVRLRAPDVALAEAAIGAGLTGALMLDAIGRGGRRRVSAEVSPEERNKT